MAPERSIRPFRLSRYYSIASLVGIGVVILALSSLFRHLATQTLMEHQTRANIDLTHSFANSTWDSFSGLVERSTGWSYADAASQGPELARLQTLTREQMRGTNVLKVKIYNLEGLTVFSTDPAQIGEDKSANKGFLQAKTGQVASEITFRDEFYGFEAKIAERNIVASYIPIHDPLTGSVSAVFEVYSDVTPLVHDLEYTQTKVIIGVFSCLTLLYLFLFLIVRRADAIIAAQERERAANEEKIRQQAYHDSLTGLPNRNSFNDRIKESLDRARRHGKQGALMFLDLDRFKLVNDSLGHEAGDQILKITAQRIQSCIRETDMAFRISGDEFVVILEDLDHGEDAAFSAERMLAETATPVSLSGYDIVVNMSIGISVFPRPGLDVDALVKEADSAMYRAKQSGQKRYEFFSPEMTMAASERLMLETELQQASRNQEFVLHYQTRVDADSLGALGVEALLRWRHPKKGLVYPTEFIPLLEETGLINTVGSWVLATACRQAQSWMESGLGSLRMSVNISAVQFRHSDFVRSVAEAVESSGLDPSYLELELTESMFVQDTEYAIEMMRELKKLGVKLSIDDFGSGYSSLSYLKQFPVDYLKIDRSFVEDIASDEKDRAITTAIATLAHSLGLGLVAEGVENERQLKLLRDKGCHELQGFLFSKPVPSEELEKSLARQTSIATS